MRDWLRPGLLGLHAFAAAAIAVCVVGGLWQLGVYDARQEHERADRQEVPTVPLGDIWVPGQPFTPELNHRPVEVSGTFAPAEEQIWVSGREQDGRDGFWLVAPLVVDGGEAALLVVRGFTPEVGDPPAVPEGAVTLHAVLEPGEGAGAPIDDRRVVGTLRIPALLNEMPHPLYSGYAISTTESAAGGLPLAVTPEPDVSWTVGLRNLAYSLQWWVFGLFALFMWWRMCTDQVAQARARREPEQEEELV